MESHDEERLMYKNIPFGNSAAGYNIKDTTTALKRQEIERGLFIYDSWPQNVLAIWRIGL